VASARWNLAYALPWPVTNACSHCWLTDSSRDPAVRPFFGAMDSAPVLMQNRQCRSHPEGR
jgi:hypothetical protein